MTTSYSTSGPDGSEPPNSARACPTTKNRRYPYDGRPQFPGQSNFAGVDGVDEHATLAGRLDYDMTGIEQRLKRLEHTSMEQGQFPTHVVDASWMRWNLETGLGFEPSYSPHPGSEAYRSSDGEPMPYSKLVTTRGPVRRIGPPLHANLVSAILVTYGPDMLAAAIGAVQWCASRLLAAGIDASIAMSAGRPGSCESDALRRVIREVGDYRTPWYLEPVESIARVGAILHDWVTGRHYAEVAENYADAVSVAVAAIGAGAVDLKSIDEYCDPGDRHSGAAGWLMGRADAYDLTEPGGATDAV